MRRLFTSGSATESFRRSRSMSLVGTWSMMSTSPASSAAVRAASLVTMRSAQIDLFAPAPALPPGFRHSNEAIPRDEERALLEAFLALDFAAFAFHGHVGRRRFVSFGRAYDFEREALRGAPPIPPFLLALRGRVAALAGLAPETLSQVLITQYPPSAGIGRHRDKAVFGYVLGVSLGVPCLFRLRRRAGASSWHCASLRLEPRSAYLLRGPARTQWEHSIPPGRRCTEVCEPTAAARECHVR